jgi:adenosylcobinamide kinase/adenosylcobinamide-phosphate guanylyltransferase
MPLTLIIGGARSGKSALAQRLAESSGRPVLFVATMEPGDDEMRARIAAHRAERPQHWRTVEEPRDAVAAIERSAQAGDCVVLDCVTVWTSNLLLAAIHDVDAPSPDELTRANDAVSSAARAFASWATVFDGEVIAVTNEAGAGVVPAYAAGRAFRDALGAANTIIAAASERVFATIAGFALELRAAGARRIDDISGGNER